VNTKNPRISVLMCAPTHYTIRYEINPWMKIKNRINPQKAHRQWNALYQTLRRLDVDVWLVPQKQDSPDMVFTANAGVVKGKIFIPSRFRYPQRRSEEYAFMQFFKSKGLKIRKAAKKNFFEGEGDLLSYRNMIFGGVGFRSEIKAHELVARALGRRFVPLQLASPHFYHLDTCFFPVDERTVLYYPGAFDAPSKRMIKRLIENPIPVSRRDALAFGCNALRVGKTIVLNKAGRALKSRLKSLGYDVLETPTSEFIKAGGSVKCLVLKL
jgi:N-dimethylarginine dimethylaminohydrolase